MKKVSDLPVLNRPREKALRYGLSSLADHELIAIILGVGSKKENVIDISYHLISEFGLYDLFKQDLISLTKYHGIGPSKALKLIACFELANRYYVTKSETEKYSIKVDSEFLYKKYYPYFQSLDHEEFMLIVLNRKRKIIYEKIIYVGNENTVDVSIKEILQLSLNCKGSCLYIIHNHPNGSTEPSVLDETFTVLLTQATEKVGIKLLGHLIIGDHQYITI